MLNDECTLQTPSIRNFAINLKNSYQNDLAAPISWNNCGQKTSLNTFIIRHFTNDVIYTVVIYNIYYLECTYINILIFE